MTTTALLITTEGEVKPTTLPDDGAHLVLNDLCGGWLDCVRTDEIVGYVNDEGLLIGLAPNLIASALFQRPLVGDCVVVGALNERGEYDGENHDVPAKYLSPSFALLATALSSDEEYRRLLTYVVENTDWTPTITAVTDEEWDDFFRQRGAE